MVRRLIIAITLLSAMLIFQSFAAAQQFRIKGVIKSVNTNDNTTMITVQKEGETEERTFEIARGATLTLDGRSQSLEALANQTGKAATLTTSDGRLVTEIRMGRMLAWWMTLLMLGGAVVLSSGLGNYLAKSMRMADYGWKIGLILSSVSCGLVIVGVGWPPRFGVDLRGGVTLIYEIADPEPVPGEPPEKPDAAVLATLLQERVDPSGTKEVVIRPYGNDRIEIIVPDVGEAEVENVKKRVTQAGYLQFMIVANKKDHEQIIEQAKDPAQKEKKFVVDASGKAIGKWVGVKREEEPTGGIYPYKTEVWGDTLRDANTAELIEISDMLVAQFEQNPRSHAFEQWLKQNGHEEIEVLMAANDPWKIEGAHLASVRSAFDQRAEPCINFNPTARGAILFGALTSDNMPDPKTGFPRRLGIVLDDELYSAPNIRGVITNHGQITGSFTREEVDYLVSILRAGKLPATLEKQPLSEDRIDSHLGREMREKGIYAIAVSLVMVIVFMAVYYQFSGVVACFALLINLVCIVAMIILVKQPFSLTGLAGLVLTIGMSVDANVLVFERIREELDRGSALRMAIRNGFDRAMTTIVDANLTTLLTGIVLYAIGTEQIRGFAVTLILGILFSMYTAIFCSRVAFEIAERQRWIKHLRMWRIFGGTRIDFLGWRTAAITASMVLIVIGMVAVAYRGRGILAIDLSGGTSIRLVLKEPLDADVVREKIRQQIETWDNGRPLRINGARVTFTVTPMSPEDLPPKTAYRVDTSIPEPDPEEKNAAAPTPSELQNYPELATIIQAAFTERDESGNESVMLAMHALQFADLQAVEPEIEKRASGDQPPDAVGDSAPPNESAGAAPPSTEQPKPTDGADSTGLSDSILALAMAPTAVVALGEDANSQETTEQEKGKPESSEAKSIEPKSSEAGTAESPVASGKETDSSEKPTESADKPDATVSLERALIASELQFRYEIEKEALVGKILTTAADLQIDYLSESDVILENRDPRSATTPGHKHWALQLKSTKADAQKILEQLKIEYDNKPYFRGESGVGSQIAGHTQVRALGAILASLLGIVAYIWVRFQKAVFGVAAVVALIHDVLVVVGAIAVSLWFSSALGFLGVEEFKISLPVVAALLTIIGYSLNDTIVVFDRIREVRGKSPDLTAEMLNVSICQTLSRTILTALTTLIVVVILYAGGGEAIHGFAFALVVGVVVGTYSSIFIAAPILLWMIGTEKPAKAKVV